MMARRRWNHDLARRARCSASFVREMDAQLEPAFREKTGLDLADFVVAPEVPDMFTVHRSDLVGYFRGAIVGSRLGFDVVIAWVDPAKQRLIEPTDEVTAETIMFWWHRLPAEEIVAEENRWPDPPFDVSRFSFPIDFKLKVWPHVRFTVGVRDPVDDALRRRLADVLSPLDARWRAEGRPGVFHEIGVVERVDDHTVQVDIDLGSAVVDGLTYVLEHLDRTGLVTSVALRAY
jgi:hypothetical protein